VIVHNDGTTELWRQLLAPWEVPRHDPAEPRPNAPDVARAAGQRWRERQRVGDAARRAAAARETGATAARERRPRCGLTVAIRADI
jgi:hypothetical protein